MVELCAAERLASASTARSAGGAGASGRPDAPATAVGL